jgi:hypothetical protein
MKDIRLRVFGILLVSAVLFGQGALLKHEYNFAAHKAGHTCVICLHATPLSHALGGSLAVALALPIVKTEFYVPAPQIIAIAQLAYHARAPPSIPSV